MPQLLFMVPCEKVAVCEADNSVSLLSIVQGFDVYLPSQDAQVNTTPPEPPPAPGSVVRIQVPVNWAIFTLWRMQDGDEGKKFEEKCELFTPSGRMALTTTIEFQQVRPFHRVTAKVQGFPMDEAGQHTIKLFVREKGKAEFIEAATYPIWVTHSQAR